MAHIRLSEAHMKAAGQTEHTVAEDVGGVSAEDGRRFPHQDQLHPAGRPTLKVGQVQEVPDERALQLGRDMGAKLEVSHDGGKTWISAG